MHGRAPRPEQRAGQVHDERPVAVLDGDAVEGRGGVLGQAGQYRDDRLRASAGGLRRRWGRHEQQQPELEHKRAAAAVHRRHAGHVVVSVW
jgi:hypothetical protein